MEGEQVWREAGIRVRQGGLFTSEHESLHREPSSLYPLPDATRSHLTPPPQSSSTCRHKQDLSSRCLSLVQCYRRQFVRQTDPIPEKCPVGPFIHTLLALRTVQYHGILFPHRATSFTPVRRRAVLQALCWHCTVLYFAAEGRTWRDLSR